MPRAAPVMNTDFNSNSPGFLLLSSPPCRFLPVGARHHGRGKDVRPANMDPKRIAAIEVGAAKCPAAIGHRATFRQLLCVSQPATQRTPLGSYSPVFVRAMQSNLSPPLGWLPLVHWASIRKCRTTASSTPPETWQGLDYLDLAEFGVPIAVDSDVNAAGLAEFVEGAARGCRRAVYITWKAPVSGAAWLSMVEAVTPSQPSELAICCVTTPNTPG